MRRNNINIILAFLLLLLVSTNNVEATIVPSIEVYHKTDYKGGQANRGFAQDNQGNLYIANSEGLLTYNGVDFRLFPISNKTQVLALEVGPDNRVYVGGQGDFGYFTNNQVGQLEYYSLKEFIPKEHQNFSDIRNISVTEKGVYFKSLFKIFYWDINKREIQTINNDKVVEYISEINQTVFIDDENGLYILKEGIKKLYPSGEIFKSYEASSAIQCKEKKLVSTWKNGIFELLDDKIIPFVTEIDQKLKSEQIKCMVATPKNQIAVGTVSGGIYFLDQEGNLISNISKENGLKSNSIQHLYYDQYNNLWVGLENGINYVKTGKPFRFIFPNPKQELIGYAARVFNQDLYLSTSLGLFKTQLDRDGNIIQDKFEMIEGSSGLCWNLSEVNDELYLHKHEGFFKVNRNGLGLLRKGEGSWIAKKIKKENEDVLLEGNYFGIKIFNADGSFITVPFKESSRIIEQNEKYIWISHDYKGAYRLKYDFEKNELINSTFFNHENGFPSDIDINVFSINDETIFTTEKGIYYFDDEQDSLLLHPVLNKVFGQDCNLKRLVQDDFGRLWFVDRKKVGYLNLNEYLSQGDIQKKYLPELEGLLVEHFQHIYPYSKERIYFGTENGFIEYHLENEGQHSDEFNIQFNRISFKTSLDSVLYDGFRIEQEVTRTEQGAQIPFTDNSIKFDFAANYFNDLESIQFSTYLQDFEESWTDWNTETQRTFTNLSPGDYTFYIKAKNAQGIESKIKSYLFSIQPPWYQTLWAKLILALLVVVGLYLLWLIPRRRHLKETEDLKEEQKHELESKEKQFSERVRKSEEELMRLKNEKLKNEVEFKNHELASSTMHLVQKGEMLSSLKEELSRIQNIKNYEKMKLDIKKVIRKIDQDLRLDENWGNFEHYFDQVHTDFIKNLREKYPQLTPKDYKLCVYLRMNLSSKEIATLMNITTRSVEVSRYRLRKKLNIEKNLNLTDFIMDI